MRSIKRGLVAVASLCLVLAAGSAGFAKRASVKQPTTSRCASIDAGTDIAIARGPQSGPGHDALVNGEARTLRQSGCATEPTLTTTLSSTTVPSGSPIHDTATLSGAFSPTGQIAFTVWQLAPGFDCSNSGSGTPVPPPADVNGNGSYTSASFTPQSSGDYAFAAYWGGDGNNPAAVSECERFTVTGGTAK